jgi:hypothetical protein
MPLSRNQRGGAGKSSRRALQLRLTVVTISESAKTMPRFVVLEHDHPHLHWDLMLEAGETLRSWRLAQPLSTEQNVAAVAIGDHRRVYLDYEGPVSGGRGKVKRFDAGAFDWIENGDAKVVVRLDGVRLRGELVVERAADGSVTARFASR